MILYKNTLKVSALTVANHFHTVLSTERFQTHTARGHAQLSLQGRTCEKNIPEPPEKKLMVSLNSRSHIHPIPKGNVSSYCAK